MKQLTDAQWKRISEDYSRMYLALFRITKYQSPERLRREAQNALLPYEECLEYAYDNVLTEAKRGLGHVRKPFVEKAEFEPSAVQREGEK
jgi:hypothetical protein